MTSVEHLLKIKGRDVWTATPDETVFDALHLMAERDVGALVVVEGDKVAGIFSERDYARKVILEDRCSKDTRLGEIMSTQVLCVTPAQTTQECMAIMTQKHARHLPVVDDGRLVGLISIGDVVKEIIDVQKFMIDRLEDYIQSS